jgi:hypothetical protein
MTRNNLDHRSKDLSGPSLTVGFGALKYRHFGSRECGGSCDLEVTSREILTSSEPSIRRDTWREINVSLTHRRKKSKGRIVRTREARVHDLTVAVRSEEREPLIWCSEISVFRESGEWR